MVTDLSVLYRRVKPNLPEVAAHHRLLRPVRGPPRLLDLCLFHLRRRLPPGCRLEGAVAPEEQLASQSLWPGLAKTPRAAVFFSISVRLALYDSCQKEVKCRTGVAHVDRERGGYSKRTELAVSVITRRDEARLYVDLPFCPSDCDEIFALLLLAMSSSTFRPVRDRLKRGWTRPNLSLHVRCSASPPLFPRRQHALSCYYSPPSLPVVYRPSSSRLAHCLTEMGAKFREGATRKLTNATQ